MATATVHARVAILAEEVSAQAWHRYASAVTSDVPRPTSLDEVPTDIAHVTSAVFTDPTSWLNRPIPAFGMTKPVELMDSAKGRDAVRALLMRMPCQ